MTSAAAPDRLREAHDRKAESTLQAIAARAGVTVDPMTTDAGQRVYVVNWRALTKQCDTLADVANLLRRMGVDGVPD